MEALVPGSVLDGRYVLVEQCGWGASSIVFQARDQDTHRLVAVKVFRQRGMLQNMLHESAVLARVQTPHVVRALDTGRSTDGRPFLVMEWLDGPVVAAALRAGPIPWPEASLIVRAVAEGLATLHRVGIIHRDVKPDNLMFDALHPGAEIRLIDLGLGREEAGLGAAGVAGTPEYMAPDVWDGAPVSGSDMYALGCSFYELLTGNPPFRGEWPELMLAHSRSPPPMLAGSAEVPETLRTLLHRLLAKDGADRPTASDVVAALEIRPELRLARLDELRRRLGVGREPGGSAAAAGGGEEVDQRLVLSPRQRALLGLESGAFAVDAGADPSYNALAWAAKEEHRVWAPNPRVPGVYWPPNVVRSDDVASVIAALGTVGFHMAGVEATDCPERVEYVALYATDGRVRHAARQEADGWWSSKLGLGPRIRHRQSALQGGVYGRVVAVLVRARDAPTVIDLERVPSPTRRIADEPH